MPQTARRESARHHSPRRRFLRSVGAAGAAGALGLALGACRDDEREASLLDASPPQTEAGNDLEIVNFVLNLERLQADLYDQALDSGLLTGEVHDLAREFRATEREHVRTLKAVAAQLGEPVEAPRTDFSQALAGQGTLVATLARLENLGAAAYLGVVPSIQDRELLATALSIHSVEGRHAAALNEVIGRSFAGNADLVGSIPDGAFASPMSMDDVREEIERFLASS